MDFWFSFFDFCLLTRKMKKLPSIGFFFANKEKYPNAEYLSLNGFYLPSGLGIKNYEIDYVATTLNEILK